MNPVLEQIVVALLVGGAAAFFIIRYLAQRKSGCGSGCGSCGPSSSSTNASNKLPAHFTAPVAPSEAASDKKTV